MATAKETVSDALIEQTYMLDADAHRHYQTVVFPGSARPGTFVRPDWQDYFLALRELIHSVAHVHGADVARINLLANRYNQLLDVGKFDFKIPTSALWVANIAPDAPQKASPLLDSSPTRPAGGSGPGGITGSASTSAATGGTAVTFALVAAAVGLLWFTQRKAR